MSVEAKVRTGEGNHQVVQKIALVRQREETSYQEVKCLGVQVDLALVAVYIAVHQAGCLV